MPGRLLLGLFLLWLACPSACVQGADHVVEPWDTTLQLQRLPLADPLPVPANEAGYVPNAGVNTGLEGVLLDRLWQGSLQLGLIGSEGNTESFNLRAGFDAKRKTDHNTFTVSLDYYRRTSKALKLVRNQLQRWRVVRYARTRNRIDGQGLLEHLFSRSPWTSFVVGTMDYDEAQPFDVRFSTHLGLGYRFVDTATTSLIGRMGGGFSHEVDGPDNRYLPEALLGLQLEHRISRRQKLTGRAEYYPNLTDFSEYRMHGEAAWEALISEEMNLSFKLRVLDRYDSTPYRSLPNDLDYSALLLWRF